MPEQDPNRIPRDSETREETKRKITWTPPNKLPNPTPRPGVAYRWVRTSTLGDADPANVSERMREGWTPVRAADHPELKMLADPASRFEGAVEIGGLILCQNSEENAVARREYYENLANSQIESVDNSLMRQNDPRMPLHKPQRKTRVSFGGGLRRSKE
jgi:hypothetical protein